MRLSRQQIDTFHEQGFVIVEGVLEERDLAPLIEALEAWIEQRARKLHAEGKITSLHEHKDFEHRYAKLFAECAETGQGLDIMQSFLEPVFEFLRNKHLMEAVGSLIGPEILCNPIQHLRAKPPAGRAKENQRMNVPWHQDAAVTWEEADRSEIVTTWLPLVDASAENGCMEILPGVHKRGYLRHQSEGGTTIVPELLPDVKAVRGEVKKGGAIFMHRFTPHRSTDNLSDGVRWSMDLRYQPIGQPTGRPFYPAFVTHSAAHPETVETDYGTWRRRWREDLKKAQGVPWHRTADKAKREEALALAK